MTDDAHHQDDSAHDRRPDRREIARCAARALGGELSAGPPSPGTRLARMNAIYDAHEAGEIDNVEVERRVDELVAEAAMADEVAVTRARGVLGRPG